MLRKALVLTAAIGVLLAAPAVAQDRFEVSGFYGWTFVDGSAFPPPSVTGPAYARADARDSSSFGFTFGYWLDSTFEVEFLWSREPTTLDVTGTGPTASGSMAIHNAHGQVVYHFGDPEWEVSPLL